MVGVAMPPNILCAYPMVTLVLAPAAWSAAHLIDATQAKKKQKGGAGGSAAGEGANSDSSGSDSDGETAAGKPPVPKQQDLD
jgi:hypothetical protein